MATPGKDLISRKSKYKVVYKQKKTKKKKKKSNNQAMAISSLSAIKDTQKGKSNLFALSDWNMTQHRSDSSGAKDHFASTPALRKEFEDGWFDMAVAALENHPTTLAIMPIDNLLRRDGPLDRMRARGYLVEEP